MVGFARGLAQAVAIEGHKKIKGASAAKPMRPLELKPV
jgi:hypothetical protein